MKRAAVYSRSGRSRIVAKAEAPVVPPVTWRDWRKRNARRIKVAGLGFLALLAAIVLWNLAPQRGLTQAEVEVAVQKILDAQQPPPTATKASCRRWCWCAECPTLRRPRTPMAAKGRAAPAW
jgi:hypothetical protein